MRKYVFNFLILLSTQAFAQGVPLVWQISKNVSWEASWLNDILDGVELVNIYDGKYQKFINNSIVVFSSCFNSKGCKEYFEEMHKRGYTFGIIHLSDEAELGPSTFYPYAAFVFRNYWRKDFENQANVITFPIGYAPKFWQDGKKEPVKALERNYTWSFAGQIYAHPTRVKMMRNMLRIPNYYFHKVNTWGLMDQKSLTIPEYREMLLNTIFSPCPAGWLNVDSFRVYESLECGCIPIVEKFPEDYFKNLFPNHPFISINSWDEVPRIIRTYIQDPEKLEKKRLECYEWWTQYKKNLNKKFISIIKENLTTE